MTNATPMIGDFVTVSLDDQTLGLPVLRVHDVLKLATVTRVPGAPPMVAGVMNLRGRIVTAIDLRSRLGLPRRAEGAKAMCVVVEHEGQPYALVVDGVGDVLRLPADRFDPSPATLAPRWRAVATGVYRLDRLVLALNIDALFTDDLAAAA
jgi:purine-binding chemotaxis protein CheW